MPTIRWRGTRAELAARLASAPAILAGKVADPAGAARLVLERVGAVLQRKIYEAYEVKSVGGQDAMGISWPPLSGTTLALRSFRATAARVEELKKRFRRLPEVVKQLVRKQASTVANVLLGEDKRSRRAALRILGRDYRRGRVNKATYERQKAKLEQRLPAAQLRREAYAAAFAAILVKTRRLIESFTPGSPDSFLRVTPGQVSVSSKVPYFPFHNSKQPRKQKKDGSGPVLPRRQILPDDESQLPEAWKQAMRDELRAGVDTFDFWLKVLGPQASRG